MSSPDSSPDAEFQPASLLLRGGISVLLIVATLGGAGIVFGRLASQKQQPPREDPVPAVFRVETYVVEAMPLRRYLAAFGTARADREVVVGAEVAGRTTETGRQNVGDRVEGPQVSIGADGKSLRHPGSTIVRIDPQTYEERVQQAQSQISQSRVDLERLDQEHATNDLLIKQQQERLVTARREYERARTLLAQQAGRESDVSQAELQVQQYDEGLIRLRNEQQLYPIRRQQAEAKLQASTSDLALAMLELEKAHVRAPFTGVISAIHVEEGQYVRPGDPLVRITDLDIVEVPLPIGLPDAAIMTKMLAAGERPRAELVTDESRLFTGDTPWEGVVTRISPIADEHTRTVNVFVEVDNRQAHAPLLPGSFVFARVAADVIPEQAGLLIPRDAIVDGQVFVAVAREAEADEAARSEARSVPVTVVNTYQSFALVRGDLPEGAEIVMTNLDVVIDGALLEVRDRHTLAEEFRRLQVPYLMPLERELSPASSTGEQ